MSIPKGTVDNIVLRPPTKPFQSIFTNDGYVMLAAIVILLLVILFVLLLHAYAKWFLDQARQRRRSTISVSHALGPPRFHHFPSFTFDASASPSPSKAFDASIIASIPLFVFKLDENRERDLECVICLGDLADGDTGRKLPKCQHVFHLECIDMWLHSHSSCPICRTAIVCEKKDESLDGVSGNVDSVEERGELPEVGCGEGNSRLEILVDGISDSVNGNRMSNDCLPVSSSSLSAQSLTSSSLGCSLKRMLSSRSEQKVFPASDVNESNV